MNKKSGVGLTLVKILFFIVIAIEGYFCYKWLVEPIIPVIKDLWGNQGLPSVSYQGLDNISIFGMDSKSAGSLIFHTFLRFTVFSIVFGVTVKVFSIIKSIFR